MHVRDVEAAGSNPVTSTNHKPAWILDFPVIHEGFFMPFSPAGNEKKRLYFNSWGGLKMETGRSSVKLLLFASRE